MDIIGQCDKFDVVTVGVTFRWTSYYTHTVTMSIFIRLYRAYLRQLQPTSRWGSRFHHHMFIINRP